MTILPALQDLQHIHDQLRTIERDLTAFPPDLARLNTERQTLAKRITDLNKLIPELEAKERILLIQLDEAQKHEAASRKGVKAATQKTQYAAAIRELDERERASAAVQRPLKELQGQLTARRADLQALEASLADTQTQFDELHAIFLGEHANQVAARDLLKGRLAAAEALLPPADLTRFNRLLQARQGRAVAAVDNSTCQGCRTKIRIPVMTQLREQSVVTCESCQRYLFLAPRA